MTGVLLQIQKIIELTNVPYTNSGIRASELAMDKHKSSEVFTKINLSYPNTVLSSLKSIKNDPVLFTHKAWKSVSKEAQNFIDTLLTKDY